MSGTVSSPPPVLCSRFSFGGSLASPARLPSEARAWLRRRAPVTAWSARIAASRASASTCVFVIFSVFKGVLLVYSVFKGVLVLYSVFKGVLVIFSVFKGVLVFFSLFSFYYIVTPASGSALRDTGAVGDVDGGLNGVLRERRRAGGRDFGHVPFWA